MKDIGKKRKEREKKSHKKVLRRRNRIRLEAKKEREKQLLEVKEKQLPIRNGEILERNLETLKNMEGPRETED